MKRREAANRGLNVQVSGCGEGFSGITAGRCSHEIWGGKYQEKQKSENGQNVGPLNVQPLLGERGFATGYPSLKLCACVDQLHFCSQSATSDPAEP